MGVFETIVSSILAQSKKKAFTGRAEFDPTVYASLKDATDAAKEAIAAIEAERAEA